MEQLFYKKKLMHILFITIGLLLLYANIIYFVDPLQQYRLATFFKAVYINEIYQNPGLAKHYNYNAVIIGSSMTENFRPSYIRKKLGWQALKLSISGSNSFEEKIMLETAIKTGRVKNVIYGLDFFRLAEKNAREGFPDYLYLHQSIMDKLKYLFNIGNIDFILKTMIGNLGLAYKDNMDLDSVYTFNDKLAYSAENVILSFNNKLKQGEKLHFSLAEMKLNFNANILSVFKNNPNITFYLFFPPYSVYMYKLYEHEGKLFNFLEMKKYVCAVTKNLSNVKLYDFQSDSMIIENLNNYKDIYHYSEEINNYIIDNFNKKKYVVTADNQTG